MSPDSAGVVALKTRSSANLPPQQFANGEVHGWYRIIHGYSDHLVASLLRQFRLPQAATVLDPFCGTGTTLIECAKAGIASVGVDANPACVFAAKVKTNWALLPERLLELVDRLDEEQQRKLKHRSFCCDNDPTFRYLTESGMVRRGWISPEPLRRSIAIKQAIPALITSPGYRNALKLALVAEVVAGASNVKFGPELYCGPAKEDWGVMKGVRARVENMAGDLRRVRELVSAPAIVKQGDARFLAANDGPFDAVICSPPYPAEHDYTRNTRLELAFLEFVTNLRDLRRYKRLQIRSHTKGIYKGDNDGRIVRDHPDVSRLASRIEEGVKDKKDGFAQLYSTVVREYFGGMKKHFVAVRKVLKPHAAAAYVVGDQSGYAGVHIPTADVLASLARECGFEVAETRTWRTRRSSLTGHTLVENILILKKPGAGRRRRA